MSLTTTQLYANNAKSTLSASISASTSTITLTAGQGTRFPTPGANEFFAVTLQTGDTVEVCYCTYRVGDVLTVTRGMEGTNSITFPTGTTVQMRVTRDTLGEMARKTDRMYDMAPVDLMPAASTVVGNSIVCASGDDFGNPVVAVKRADLWRFITHSKFEGNGAIQTSTKTSFVSSSLPSIRTIPAEGRMIVQFTSGELKGQARHILGINSTQLTWSTPTTVAPSVGTTYEVYTSNAYVMSQLDAFSDDSIINAIIFGT